MVSIGPDVQKSFINHLKDHEYSPATIARHMQNLQILNQYAKDGYIRDKDHLNGFRAFLRDTQKYATGTINSILITVNKLFTYMREENLCEETWHLRGEKVQKRRFIPEEKELTREEYERLVSTAHERGNTRLAMLIQTICATGIRISELAAITVECLAVGRAVVRNKGKERSIIISQDLEKGLRQYCAKRKILSGPIFITRTGRPLDRSNIWRMLKKLAKIAKVNAEKVFPHNLRHLFARIYYDKTHDISRLADLLGHSSIETTRIYVAVSSKTERTQVNALHLFLRI